jgi:hypothetical protein
MPGEFTGCSEALFELLRARQEAASREAEEALRIAIREGEKLATSNADSTRETSSAKTATPLPSGLLHPPPSAPSSQLPMLLQQHLPPGARVYRPWGTNVQHGSPTRVFFPGEDLTLSRVAIVDAVMKIPFTQLREGYPATAMDFLFAYHPGVSKTYPRCCT